MLLRHLLVLLLLRRLLLLLRLLVVRRLLLLLLLLRGRAAGGGGGGGGSGGADGAGRGGRQRRRHAGLPRVLLLELLLGPHVKHSPCHGMSNRNTHTQTMSCKGKVKVKNIVRHVMGGCSVACVVWLISALSAFA